MVMASELGTALVTELEKELALVTMSGLALKQELAWAKGLRLELELGLARVTWRVSVRMMERK